MQRCEKVRYRAEVLMGVGKKDTHRAGHVVWFFSANQLGGLKSGRQIIEVRYIGRQIAR